MTPNQGYVGISRRALDLEDYVDIMRRHIGWIVGPLFAGLVISCVIAFVLPNTYVSQAAMRITPAQVPESIAPSILNQQMSDRINQMQQDILSRTSLSQIIQDPRLDLYKSERDRQPLEDVIEKMRTKDIAIRIMSIAGQGNRPASAFSISFAYPDAHKAQAVVQVLLSKFTESNVNVQTSQGTITRDYLKDELDQAKSALDKTDRDLTEFRMRNQGRLPEESQINVQALTALQSQRSSIDESLNRNTQEKLMLESSLQTLQTQYDAVANSAPTMEDMGTAAKNDRLAQLNRTISDTEARLTGLREIYTETYPDIRNFKAQLTVLKNERDRLQKQEEDNASKPKAPSKRILNPAMTKSLADLRANIEATKASIRAHDIDRQERLRQIEGTNRQIQMYQSRLEGGPANQQKYVEMMHQHEMAEQRYQDLQKKQGVADSTKNIIVRKAGENLEVLDPASLPESPTAPNRWLITGIGVGVGLLTGVFLAGVREMKDGSLKNLKDVRAYTNLPVLSSIPLLENDLLVQRKRRIVYLGWSAAVILGVLAMSGSIYYHFVRV